MKASDIANAAMRTGVNAFSLCEALRQALPVFHEIKKSTSSWKIWLRPGINFLILGIEAYVATCDTSKG